MSNLIAIALFAMLIFFVLQNNDMINASLQAQESNLTQANSNAYASAASMVQDVSTALSAENFSVREILETTTSVTSVYDDCAQNPEKYDLYDGKYSTNSNTCFGFCSIQETMLYGTSMIPTIMPQTLIKIKSDATYDLSVGKIVAFDSLGQASVNGLYTDNIIHRIVGVENADATLILIDGDNLQTILVSKEQIEVETVYKNKQITLKRPFYITKGDNNSYCEIVASNMIKGVLVL